FALLDLARHRLREVAYDLKQGGAAGALVRGLDGEVLTALHRHDAGRAGHTLRDVELERVRAVADAAERRHDRGGPHRGVERFLREALRPEHDGERAVG